jgi:hypothetical protein
MRQFYPVRIVRQAARQGKSLRSVNQHVKSENRAVHHRTGGFFTPHRFKETARAILFIQLFTQPQKLPSVTESETQSNLIGPSPLELLGIGRGKDAQTSAQKDYPAAASS